MGKHFLFVMWNGGGTVAPELGLARQLMARGHRVTVLGDETIARDASAAGTAFVGYRHARNLRADALDDWQATSPPEAIGRAITRVICGPALDVARDVLAVHAEDPADCVTACVFLPGALVAAERAGVPSVVLCPNVDLRPAPGRPGFGPGLHPLEGPDGLARDAEIWGMCRELFATGQPALDAARRELGLEPTSHLWDEYDRAGRVLLLTSRHFEYPYEPPPNTVFAGPVLDDPFWAEAADVPPADSRPLVLVSLGSSFQNQLEQYRRIVTALADLPVDGLVTLGGVFDPFELEAPANVRIVRSAPHGPLLERASILVSHCGHGSVMKALAAGVPMLCMPISREQPENAARVDWHGAGIRLDPGAASADIRMALARMLDDDRFASNARVLGRKIRSEVDEGIAVRELEAVVGSTRVQRSRAAASDGASRTSSLPAMR